MKIKETKWGYGIEFVDDVQGKFLYVAQATSWRGYPLFVVRGFHENGCNQPANGYVDVQELRRIADALNTLANMADGEIDLGLIGEFIHLDD